MLNTEKQEILYQAETQNKENRSTIHPNTTKETLTQEDKINLEKMKKSTLSSFRNQDWKKIKIETEGKDKRIINIYANLQHH